MRRNPAPVPPAADVPERVDLVGELQLVPVQNSAQSAIWNELMITEHPLGKAALVGYQCRYLVGSSHGWLGAVGFAASARRLAARDRWIGWDDKMRERRLHRIVGLSRFLIRPGIVCRNLASQVLSMSLRTMARDFEKRYGYRPWLVETFIDPARHLGVSLQASNWVHVGETCGRGRQDRKGLAAGSVKEIYMYELEPDCRAVLSARPVNPVPVGEGLSRECWAENEFGGAPLGDKRLAKRLVDSAHVQAEAPRSPFSVAAGGNMAAVTGFYRLIDRPRDVPGAVTPENILAPHKERTLGRMQTRNTVLCLQDGTDLNFATRAQCDDLGVIGHNQTSAKTAGLHLHTTMAVDDAGLPLGLLKLEFDAPGPGKNKLPEARKSARWLRGLRECAEVARRLDGTQLISVMDREADFFEMFAEQRRLGNIDILVRARHSRKLSKTEKLFDSIRAEPVQGRRKLAISRLSQRPRVSKRKATDGRKERVADMEIRYRTVLLPPTTGAAPLPVQVVHISEPEPPEGAKPVEWFLITTVAVSSVEDAMRIVGWYTLRWRIEDWHRTLKSGCEVEETGHHTAARLERVIAINAVIAWRVMLMALLARKTPNDPAELLFSDLELLVIRDYATKLPRMPKPRTLKGAVLIVAIMAGYRNRKHDPPPGHQKIWQGYSCLARYCQAYENLAEIKKSGRAHPLLSPEQDM